MDTVKLNTLVDNIRGDYFRRSSGTQDMLKYKVNDIKMNFGKYLEDKLHAIYKNYFPFNKPTTIEDYLKSEGVPVETDESGKPRLYVSIHSYPLRVVISNPEKGYEKTAWVLNGSNQ